MNLFKGIFGLRKNKTEQNPQTLFYNQISNALDKCKNEKKTELKNISNAKEWAKDVIFEIFDVPSAYWYEELNEYENIKFHENNLSVSKELVEETDKVIEEYREQIKLSDTKIKFCETLISEYELILERYEKTIKHINKIKEDEEKLKLLNKHKKRISKMRSKTGNFDKIFEESGTLNFLNDDIKKIEDDFKIKQEVTEYIKNLDKEFFEDTDNIDSFEIRKEIEKLTSKIKNK